MISVANTDSAIFPQDAEQERLAKDYIHQLSDSGVFLDAIATTVESGQAFYPAEAYHHDYAAKHPEQPYIQAVSEPKAEKLRSYFRDYLVK